MNSIYSKQKKRGDSQSNSLVPTWAHPKKRFHFKMKMTIIIVRKLVLLIFPSFSTISGEPHISFFPCFHFQLIYRIYFHLRVLFSPQKASPVCSDSCVMFVEVIYSKVSLLGWIHYQTNCAGFWVLVTVCPSRLRNTISNNPRLNNSSAVREWSVNTKNLNIHRL